MRIALLIWIVGLILSLIFTKTKFSDSWVEKIGYAMFCAGLLAWLLTGARY